MPDDYKISLYQGKSYDIAKYVDENYGNRDGKLLGRKEISIFYDQCEKQNVDPWCDSINMFFPKTDKSKNLDKVKDVENIVKDEVKSCKVVLSNEDLKFWAETISAVSKDYKVPAELIVSIIGKETKFVSLDSTASGTGVMQVTTISVEDFFPGAKKSRTKVYKNLNNQLLEDILYTTDAQGNKILKYKSPTELRKACKDDHDLGIKTGLLIFQMKYVEVISSMKGLSVNSVINRLKNKSLKLQADEMKDCLTIALKNYNSQFNTYSKDVIDSLVNHGYDFAEQSII